MAGRKLAARAVLQRHVEQLLKGWLVRQIDRAWQEYKRRDFLNILIESLLPSLVLSPLAMSSTKNGNVSHPLKLDSAGLPLIPQPSDSPADPLNYPNWLKYLILAQVCLLSFLSTLSTAIINPALVPLSEEFGITPVVASYQSTAAIGASAFGPLIFTPIANVYGRRPAYLLSTLIGLASGVGAATAKSFARLVISRLFNGFGPSAALGLGAGTVVDLFYGHQRGRAMGLFVFMSTNGAHLAPTIGGYVAKARGWRWCYWTAAILNGSLFAISLFLLPETLFDRESKDTQEVNSSEETSIEEEEKKREDVQIENISIQDKPYKPPPMDLKTYLRRMWFWDLDRPASRVIKARYFGVKPLSMLRYPSVVFPILYFTISHGYSSIAVSLTFAPLFTKLFHFDPARNGLAAGMSLLLGSALGELCSGSVTDAMMRRAQKRAYLHGETPPAELRLRGIWTGAIAVPIGLLMYGFTLHYPITFIAPCIGIAVACFGIQIVTSVCYTYSCGDCYRHRSNDISMCFNFFRQVFGAPLSFYIIPFGDKIGFQWSNIIYASFTIIAFLPMVALMFRGEKWRKALGDPPL